MSGDRESYWAERAQRLEKELRLSQSALEMAASLGNFETSLSNLADPGIILEETASKVKILIRFKAVAFYLVNEEDQDFYLCFCDRSEYASFMESEVDVLLEDKTFSWALSRTRPVIITATDNDSALLLHAISTSSRTRGMFVGLLDQPHETIYDTSFALFTILLLSCAHLLESFELYRQYRRSNADLERLVDELHQANEMLKREVREKEDAKKRLGRSREELRKLTMHIQERIEEERTRLAREVHDELGQNLTALKMGISRLAKLLPKDAPQGRERVESLKSLIDNSVKTVQKISRELRPGQLDHLGLAAAMEWYIREYSSHTGLKVDFSIEKDTAELDGEHSIALYRILQESLTNVARHADAQSVRVRLVAKSRRVELSVSDDGVGIRPEAVDDAESFGLAGMKERVHALGGKMRVTGTSGKGTEVFVCCFPEPGCRKSKE